MNSDLILKFFRGQCSPDEKETIVQWLEADPDKHQKEFDDIHLLFETTKLYGPELQKDMGVYQSQSSRPRSKILRVGLRITGAAVILFACLYMVRWHTYNQLSNQMTEITVPAGQRLQMALPDGSRVWLNSGTVMEYPLMFGNRARRVKLTGEAMFEVDHDPKHPFIVETFISDIEVMGTKFNVLAEPSAKRFCTTLLSGKVKVTDTRTEESIWLEPGHEVTLTAGRLMSGKIVDPVAMQWTEGIISLKGLSFSDLMEKFQKAYDVKIIMKCQTMPTMEFESGKIRISDGIDHALSVLQHFSHFDYIKDESGTRITIL